MALTARAAGAISFYEYQYMIARRDGVNWNNSVAAASFALQDMKEGKA